MLPSGKARSYYSNSAATSIAIIINVTIFTAMHCAIQKRKPQMVKNNEAVDFKKTCMSNQMAGNLKIVKMSALL